LHDGVERLLSVFFEQGGVDMRIDLACFFKHVANALVGCGQQAYWQCAQKSR
jgi:hypothetical protein